MLKRIDNLMQKHEEEVTRIQKAYDMDKQRTMEELSQWMQLLNNPNMDKRTAQEKVNELSQKLIDMEKVRTLNAVNTHGINECAKIINRMMGYDVTKVEVTNIDDEREEMEKLSADELRELINISNKKEDN